MEKESDANNPSAEKQIIVWKDEYLTGHTDVDFQHRYFVCLINRINRELSSSKDKEYQIQLMWELVKYAELHFLTEENIFRKGDYENRERHHKLHEEITIDLAKKVQLAMNDSIDPKELVDFLVRWLEEHVIKEDKAIFSRTGK